MANESEIILSYTLILSLLKKLESKGIFDNEDVRQICRETIDAISQAAENKEEYAAMKKRVTSLLRASYPHLDL